MLRFWSSGRVVLRGVREIRKWRKLLTELITNFKMLQSTTSRFLPCYQKHYYYCSYFIREYHFHFLRLGISGWVLWVFLWGVLVYGF